VLTPQIPTRNIINNKIRVNTSQRRITHSEATMEKIRVSDGKTCHSVKPLHDGSSNSPGDKVGSPFRPTWNVLMSWQLSLATFPQATAAKIIYGQGHRRLLWLLFLRQWVLHVNENDETTRKQRRLRLPFAIHVLRLRLCETGLPTGALSIHQMIASAEMGS
jgi:hypothetical protein